MLIRLPFTKIIFLLILVFINYSCTPYQSISIEEITKKDFVKDLKMFLYDGSIYDLHANEYFINNNLLHITGNNARTISLSQIKYF